MKKLLNKTIFILLYTSFFIFLNCEKDSSGITTTEQNNLSFNFTKRYITQEEFQENEKLFQVTTKFQNRGEGNGYITEIDQSSIAEYSNSEIITYTFKSKTIDDTSKEFTNYLIFELPDGTIKEYIIRYTPNLSTRVKKFSDSNTVFNGNIELLNIDGTPVPAKDSLVYTVGNCTYLLYEPVWCECVASIELGCDLPGSGGNGTGSGSNSGNGNGNGSNGDGGNTNTGGGGNSNSDGSTNSNAPQIPTGPEWENPDEAAEIFDDFLCTGLTEAQKLWIYQPGTNNLEIAQELLNEMYENNPTGNPQGCVEFSCTLDHYYLNLNSPFSVDFSAINSCSNNQDNDDDDEKFMCIYEELTETDGFKNLFVELFFENSNLEVKLELADLPDHVAGVTESNLNDITDLKIQINRNHINTRHPIAIAQTIIHEAIHAFIKVKLYQCNNTGLTIQELNNKDLSDLLNEELEHVCNGVEGDAHILMFNKLVPYIEGLLAEVFNDLVAPEDYNPDINYYPGDGTLHAFNWPTALYYISMIGLSNTDVFIEEIGSNQYQQDLFNSYNLSIKAATSTFNFNTCN